MSIRMFAALGKLGIPFRQKTEVMNMLQTCNYRKFG